MTTARPPRSSYSWQFIALWLVTTTLGGSAGVWVSQALDSDWVIGLALGVVIGSLVGIGLYFWRERLPLAPPLPEVNARLLRWVLVITALGALFYLLAGAVGVPFNVFFPWDALGLLALCGLAALLLRRGQSFWAASCLLGSVFLPIAFNAQFYGMSSPVNALYLLGILISGLVLGSSGFFGGLMAISILTGLFALSEQLGRWVSVYPVGAPAQSVGLVLFWWAVYAAGAWLSWLFARSLERALQVSRGQTSALAQTLNALAEDADLDHFLAQALGAIAEPLGARYASLFLYDPARDLIRQEAAFTGGETWLARTHADRLLPPTPAPESPLWQELKRERRPIIVDDVSNDPRLKYRGRVLAAGIQTVLYVPLVLGEESPGFISLTSIERRRFSPDEIELAQALAQQVTLAMRLTRLAEQGRQSAVLEERNRMAREMHDTLAQGFTGIVVQLETAEDMLGDPPEVESAKQHLGRARSLARESLAEARRSVYALRPQALETEPFVDALRHSVHALAAPAGLNVQWQIDSALPSLRPELETDLLRIGQEAVTNVIKHALARQLILNLRWNSGQLEMSVRDDGRGFDAERARESANGNSAGGFGLIGMRERAARHGGRLEITSGAQGTRLNVRVPIGESQSRVEMER